MLRIAAIGLQRGAAMSGGGFDWKLRRHDVGRNADSIGTTLVTSGPLRIAAARVQQSCAGVPSAVARGSVISLQRPSGSRIAAAPAADE